MASTTFLPPYVHAVRVDEDIVFLDVAADSYLCWPDAHHLALSGDRRRMTISDQSTLAELEAAGLVSGEEHSRSPFHTPPEPVSDLWPDRNSSASRGDAWDYLRASCDAALIYPRRSFADLVAFGATRAPGVSPDTQPGARMLALVAGFHRWADWAPAPAKCLIRSFMLLRHLRRHGLDARWVFAVRTWPFEAHCWLQAGATVLDDARDRLVAYHPILVV
ncbi:MAG TPA: lasso peptide biosynthesis B2 protein [Caulobacteraceae bacterium]|jgi:hypothetical protein